MDISPFSLQGIALPEAMRIKRAFKNEGIPTSRKSSF